jgi:hypothetical protein
MSDRISGASQETPTALQPELATRLLATFRAIDNVLVAEHGARTLLKAPPPWDAPLSDGIARYGPGPVFNLWALCRAVEGLRLAWTGKPGPAAIVEEPLPVAPIDEVGPDEAVGKPDDPDSGDDKQPRLVGA